MKKRREKTVSISMWEWEEKKQKLPQESLKSPLITAVSFSGHYVVCHFTVTGKINWKNN